MNSNEFVIAMGAMLVGVMVGWWWARSKLADAATAAQAQGFQAGQQQAHHDAALGMAKLQGQLEHQAAEAVRLDGELVDMQHLHAALQGQLLELTKASGELSSGNQSLRDELGRERSSAADIALQLQLSQAEARRLAEDLATACTQLSSESQRADSQLKLLADARVELGNQFQVLANQILEEKAQRFTQQSHDSLAPLLQPLQERIKDFQKQVSDTHLADSKERLTLKTEIERLATLNHQISTDAVNLTQALKGSSKAQGIWGEMVLENLLEASGLRKGQDYIVQASFAGDEGQQFRPDVVIHLPEGKHMVVDSKMSLLAYEQYCSTDEEAMRLVAQKEHLQSLRSHAKGLSAKNYQGLADLKAPDFVLMFVPVEPAFMLAVTQDHALFNEALSRNVLIVSPTTLLATLRIVANIWRHEHQNTNAQAIAEQCGRLFDKFVGFVEDLEQVGTRLRQTQDAYESAHKKLSSGRGSLISQAGKVKQLGVKSSKSLPLALEELSLAHDHAENPT